MDNKGINGIETDKKFRTTGNADSARIEQDQCLVNPAIKNNADLRNERLACLLQVIAICDATGASLSDTLLRRVGSGSASYTSNEPSTRKLSDTWLEEAVIGGVSSNHLM